MLKRRMQKASSLQWEFLDFLKPWGIEDYAITLPLNPVLVASLRLRHFVRMASTSTTVEPWVGKMFCG